MSTIMNPALDKVVLGTMSMAEFDQAADAIKAGAQILEDVYNEAEARMRLGAGLLGIRPVDR